MIELQLLAAIALLFRLGAAAFLIIVIVKQIRLLRRNIEPRLRTFRNVLFALSVVMLLGTIWSIILDFLTIINVNTGRPAMVNWASASYVLTNSGVALVASGFIWLLYLLAANAKKISDFTTDVLKKDLGYNKKEKEKNND